MDERKKSIGRALLSSYARKGFQDYSQVWVINISPISVLYSTSESFELFLLILLSRKQKN